mmetsp:Transcript_54262/g.176323  ORF Transcript_54262/g.176323 Transcript_54262/m.176323 type:complete len:201 (-) Transcript_54262:1977-2579(-)
MRSLEEPHSNTQSGSTRPAPTTSLWQPDKIKPFKVGRSRTKPAMPLATRLAVARSSSEVNSSRTSTVSRPDAHSARPRAIVSRSRSPPESRPTGRSAVRSSSATASNAATASASEGKWASAGAYSSHCTEKGGAKRSVASVVLPLPEGPSKTPVAKSLIAEVGARRRSGIACTQRPSKPLSKKRAACSKSGASSAPPSPT